MRAQPTTTRARRPQADRTPARADYAAMARHMILRPVVTRQQLATGTGLSPGSVTKHTQWLIEHGLVSTRRQPVPHAKKPIDELWLTPGAATFLTVVVRGDRLIGELAGLDLQPFYQTEIPLRQPSQTELLEALSRLTLNAQTEAKARRRSIDCLGISAAGLVEPLAGILYSLRQIPDWEACQPWEILPAVHAIPQVNIWTQVACKAWGYCLELGHDHRVAYLECDGRAVSLAAITNGEISFGLHGTSSPWLHRSLADRGATCFCGRTGCFHQLLHSGKITSELMQRGLHSVFTAMPEDDVAVEWNHPLPVPEQALRKSGIKRLRLITTGEAYIAPGLRALTAQSAIRWKTQLLLGQA